MAGTANAALDFTGRCAVALPKAAASPRSVDWRSLPRLVQDIGADGLAVTSAANLLIGLIIGFLGVSQLGRFGAIAYVPELVVVAQFRELGPLVTAIVVAGRSGAGLASELATMKVSEEIDALRSMGFDPVRWLVVPRCLALAIAVPILTWIGDVLALVGGLVATTRSHGHDAARVRGGDGGRDHRQPLPRGPLKTPFLGLAIGLIACGQGLATRGGAAAVGARTTTAVVLAIFGVIVISAIFTLFYATRASDHARARPHIVVEDLRIGWGSRVLMEHVSFDVERGTTFAILGGSGSGKSTLLRYLIGLERPMAGRIDIDGVGEPHATRRAALRRALPVGRALQLADAGREPGASADDLDTVRGAPRALVQAKLDLVGLGAFAEHLPGEISGGMKKRAGIAARDDARARPAVLRRAVRRPRPDQRRRARSADRHAQPGPRHHHRHRDARAAEHLPRRRQLHRPRQGGEGDRGARRSAAPAGRIDIPFVHNFFTRSSPSAPATGRGDHGGREELRATRAVPRDCGSP